jgi:hypothetical protein
MVEVQHLARRVTGASFVPHEELPLVVVGSDDVVIRAVEIQVPQTWLETSLWLLVEMGESDSLPRLSLISGDDPDANDVFLSKVGTTVGSYLPLSFYESTLVRQNGETYVGVHHLKRVGNL